MKLRRKILRAVDIGVSLASAERKAQEEAEEARETLQSNTEAFTLAVQALEEERGDLTPGAYARRMRELRERYAALGVAFSDSVVVVEAPHKVE